MVVNGRTTHQVEISLNDVFSQLDIRLRMHFLPNENPYDVFIENGNWCKDTYNRNWPTVIRPVLPEEQEMLNSWGTLKKIFQDK